MKERRQMERIETDALKSADIKGYIQFLSEDGTVTLDASFTSSQLRLIADALDRILTKFPAIEDDE